MVTGMSVVFVFLIILVYVTKLLSVVVTKFFPEKEEPVKNTAKPAAAAAGLQTPPSISADAEIAAAIAAAAFHARR